MSEICAIAVPKWGIEMVEGTVSTWLKEVGDTINKGDEVFEMESDKIVNVWEAPSAGVLRRRIAEEGDTLPVGELLGVIAPADVDDAAIDSFIADFSGPAKKAEPAPAAAAPAVAKASASIAPASDGSRRVNPVVKRLAAELGIDIDSVVGTGRNGRITKEDVELAATTGGTGSAEAASTGDGDVEIIPLTPIRKTIARRLTEAKQEIPHFYLTREFELDGLLAHRKGLQATGDKISVNDLLVWCVARALMREPRANVNLVGDNIHQFKHANVSVAIATDDGLFPATVYKADTLTPQEISAATASLR